DREIAVFKGHNRIVSTIAFSPDGKTIAAGSGVAVRLWSLDAHALSQQEHIVIKGITEPFDKLELSVDGGKLAAISNGELKKLWDVTTGRELTALKGSTGYIELLNLSPDGKRLVTGGENHPIKLLDAITEQELLTLSGHGQELQSMVFSQDGKRFATGSWDGAIKLWDAITGQELTS